MTDHTLTNDDCLQILRDVADYWDHEEDPSTPMFYELMRAAANWKLDQVIDAWEMTVQSDLENGVKWLNEKAAEELAIKYPRIFAFGEVLDAMRRQDDVDQ